MGKIPSMLRVMSKEALHTLGGSPSFDGAAGGGAGPSPSLRRPSSMLSLANFMAMKDPVTPYDRASSAGDSNNTGASPAPMPVLTEEEILRQKGIDYLKMMAQRDEIQSRRTPQELMLSQKARTGSLSHTLDARSGRVPNSYNNLAAVAGGTPEKGDHDHTNYFKIS